MHSKCFHSNKGTYVLILFLKQTSEFKVGKLEKIFFKKGYYAYTGSALGRGGLKARLKHHLKVQDNPHWHIDYLKLHCEIKEIWFIENESRLEHVCADVFLKQEKFLPINKFGASDCKCISHLFYSKSPPSFKIFENEFNINSAYGKTAIKWNRNTLVKR
jgi:Uri superfamily endonuclease